MREQIWEQLEGEFDLLVIGGGATGAGLALAAVQRGLRVALVERYDFAEGTSSRSTKLIHGGIRYLELFFRTGDYRHLRLVYEALHQRHWLIRWAPHLVHPLWLITPCRSLRERLYYSAGIQLYDWLAGKARLDRPRYLTPQGLGVRFSGLHAAAGVAFADGQFDDARFNWELMRSAVALGAVAVNHAEVVALEKHRGQVRTALVRDRLTGTTRGVTAKVIVNAAGPFADTVRRLVRPDAPPLVQTSAGAHLVLRPDQPVPPWGLLIPRTEDGRVVFLLPWYGRWLLGTTDIPAAATDYPTVSDAEVEYLIRQVEPYWPAVRALPITSRWSGLRALLRSSNTTAHTVREHCIEELDGLVTLVGGKWTTFRVMAEQLLDWLRRRGLRMRRAATWPPPFYCNASSLAVTPGSVDLPIPRPQPWSDEKIPDDVRTHLRQYGQQAAAVLALSCAYPGRLLQTWPYLRAEVIYAVRYEMARTPLDFLARRIRLAFLDTQDALNALSEVVRLMAHELQWPSDYAQRMEALARQRLKQGI